MTCEEDQLHARFSKGTHTPALLHEIDPDVVKDKCPLFRQLFLLFGGKV